MLDSENTSLTGTLGPHSETAAKSSSAPVDFSHSWLPRSTNSHSLSSPKTLPTSWSDSTFQHGMQTSLTSRFQTHDLDPTVTGHQILISVWLTGLCWWIFFVRVGSGISRAIAPFLGTILQCGTRCYPWTLGSFPFSLYFIEVSTIS